MGVFSFPSLNLVLLITLYCIHQQEVVCYSCMEYNNLETSLMKNDSGNMARLLNAFFPVDGPTSKIVDVTYNITVHEHAPAATFVADTLELSEDVGSILEVMQLKFRWMASSINMYIDPSNLEKLSLYSFQTKVANVTLVIEIPTYSGECIIPSYSQIDESVCKNDSDYSLYVNLLNELTSALLYYAKHPYSKQHLQVEDEGYSALLYTENNAIMFCVINHISEFRKLYILHLVSAVIVVALLSIGTPTILVAVYSRLKKKLNKVENMNMQFFLWASAMVISVVTLLVLYVNGLLIAQKHLQYLKNYRATFLTYLTFLGGIIVLNFVTVALGMSCIIQKSSSSETNLNDFPIPHICCSHFCKAKPIRKVKEDSKDAKLKVTKDSKAAHILCCCSHADKETAGIRKNTYGSTDTTVISIVEESQAKENSIYVVGDDEGCCNACCGPKTKSIPIFLASYFFTIFLNLLSFHLVFIILGVVAAPVVALSHIAFYITSFLVLVAFMAVIFKFTNESNCSGGWLPISLDSIKNFLKFTPLVTSAFLLILCVGGYGGFYYLFTVMVQDYSYNGDLLSILGLFLPSVLLGVLGFVGKKLISCITIKQKREDEDSVSKKRVRKIIELLDKELP